MSAFTRTRAWALLAAGVVLVVAIPAVEHFLTLRNAARRGHGALAAIPSDAFLMAIVDVDALRKTPLGSPLFAIATAPFGGDNALMEACGFDPVERVSKIIFSVPEADDPGVFGVAAEGPLAKADLLSCAMKVANRAHATPSSHEQPRKEGTFTVYSDGHDVDGGAHNLELAVRDEGPYLLGKGAWLKAMIRAADGESKGATDAGVHFELRQFVPRNDGEAIFATAALPKSVRDRLKGEMHREAAMHDGGIGAMEGVLGVESAALSMGCTEAGPLCDVKAAFRCDSAGACEEVERILNEKKAKWSTNLAARLMGLGPLIDSFTMNRNARDIRLTAKVPTDAIAKMIAQLVTSDAPKQPGAHP